MGSTADYKVPRLADGHPDLQGVWGNNSVTPMTRPRQWKDKTLVTDAELTEIKQLAAQSVDQGGDAIFGNFIQQILDAKEKGAYKQTSYDPSTGNYNQFWMADREWDHRTSLIIDPPDGQFPALTPGGAGSPHRRGRASAHARAARMVPRIGRSRSAAFRTARRARSRTTTATRRSSSRPDTVVLLQEMIHDARVVPMTNKPHLPKKIRQLHGDPRGRWEGDTLVVETTNYINGFQGSTPDVKITERYTRVSPDFINWQVTVEDPATWTKPYTFMVRLKKTDGQIYEYACHEGNYAMEGILGGARMEESKKGKK